MAAELHALARQLDSSRPTMGASNQDDDFNGFTDLIAFNKYFGWYGDNMDDMGRWIDREHAAHPERKMGISEYGAGACVFQQADSLRHPEPWGNGIPKTGRLIIMWRIGNSFRNVNSCGVTSSGACSTFRRQAVGGPLWDAMIRGW